MHCLADGGSEGDSEGSGDNSGPDDDGSSTAERTATVVNVLVFSFVAWRAVTIAEGPPRAHVAEMTPTEDGVRAAVVVINPSDDGLTQVTARPVWRVVYRGHVLDRSARRRAEGARSVCE